MTDDNFGSSELTSEDGILPENIFGSKLKYVPPIIISPEAYGLPKDIDPMAQYVTRKGGGGMGDIFRGIITGLFARGIKGYSINPNYKTIFMESTGLDPEEYIHQMKTTQRERTLLVSSPHFSYVKRIYDGNVADSAALLQELSLPLIKSITSQNGGRSIVHTHDQFGGIIPAYCKARNIPSVHTLHNGFEFVIPYTAFKHTDLTDGNFGLKKYIYDTGKDSGYLYSHATAIKDTDFLTCVGKKFLEEIIAGRYDNWDIFKQSQAAFAEVKIKANHNQTRVVMNGIADEELPENQQYLPKMFGPRTKNILAAKNANKLEFQARMGLKRDENAILLYWPSRIDSTQKGIESLIGCALEVLNNNKDVQIAIVGDAQNENVTYLNKIYDEIIAHAPQASIKHMSFDKKLSNLGYASASVILGASHYEPFGLFWLQGVCTGAFGIGAENGGAVDILRQLDENTMKGNGILYKHSNAEGMKYGINTIVSIVRKLQANPELYNKIMRENMIYGRNEFSLDKMVEGYLQVFDEAAAKHKLFTDGYVHFIQKNA